MVNDGDLNQTAACEGSSELNGKDASYRNASMVSEPKVVVKRRIRGALVPIGRSI